MNTSLKMLCAAVALTCGVANAGIIKIGGVANGTNGKTTAVASACSVLFNGGNASNTCGATYTQGASLPLSSSHFRQGSVSGQYATPAGDSTIYLTVGPTDGTPVTVTLTTPANYFGFFAGSLDTYNLVQFFLNGVQVDSFTGAQINAVAFPSQATDGNQAQAQYIDYFASSLFNSLVISSSQNAFETDSHAFGVASPVPEPTSLALLGLGALGLVVGKTRRKGKAA